MKNFKIGYTDIFLDDMGSGSGKITISDTTNDYNFSKYWGSMGSDLEQFLCEINPSYFSTKLNPFDKGVFDSKQTLRSVRKHIKEEMSWELPWYKFMSAQKELRERLNEIQSTVYDARDFVDMMSSLTNDIMCFDLNYQEEKDFKSIIKQLEEEPWHFIINKASRQTIFLQELLPKIKKHIQLHKQPQQITNN